MTFAIGFLTFVMSLFSVSSISYDEFDNGNAFLFSLPITRTTYVVEKYCFGLILGLSAWTVFYAAGAGKQWLSENFACRRADDLSGDDAADVSGHSGGYAAYTASLWRGEGTDRSDRGHRYPDSPRSCGGKDCRGDGNRSGRAAGRSADRKRGSAAGGGLCGGGSSVVALFVDQPGDHRRKEF